MKKSKILAPALGVLVLSTAASISGTVAWFTANRTVTASGMSVSAKASSDLYIANSAISNNAWDTAPTLDEIASGKAVTVSNLGHNSATELIPSSTSNYSTWYYLANSSEIAPGGGIYTNAPGAGKVSSIAYAEATPNSIKDYVYVARCYVALKDAVSEGKGNLSVTATIAAGTANDDMLNVLRCAVLITDGTNDGTAALFSADGDTETKPLTAVDAVAANAVTSTASGSSAQIFTSFQSNKVYTVTMFAWFEGQDAECVNANTVASDNYTVGLSFNLA